jgi:hypothetical protein
MRMIYSLSCQAAELLLRIDKIENYLRAVDTKKDIDTTKEILEIKSYEFINNLKHGIEYLDASDRHSAIHLPYEDLQNIKLEKISSLTSILFKTNLYQANLTEANLTRATLTGSDLIKANLTRANFSQANLSNSII